MVLRGSCVYSRSICQDEKSGTRLDHLRTAPLFLQHVQLGSNDLLGLSCREKPATLGIVKERLEAAEASPESCSASRAACGMPEPSSQLQSIMLRLFYATHTI
jgi:hypothetical protein